MSGDYGKTRVSGSALMILSYAPAENDPDYVVRLSDVKEFYNTAKGLGFPDDAIIDDCTIILSLETRTLKSSWANHVDGETKYDIVMSHDDAVDL